MQTNTDIPAPPQLLTAKDVFERIKIGRSRVYKLIKVGRFPAPLKVGHSSRWLASEIDGWVETHAAARHLLS